MKKILFSFICLLAGFIAQAQVAGDTIVVPTFNYSQTYGNGIRDSMVHFPDQAGVTYEKIYMLYNMRCKNGLISPGTSGQTNIGCGEWDYSCNTYITDSTKTDSVKATHPSHIITGYSGSSYNYTTQPTYTYNQYQQQNVINTSTISETQGIVGTGSSTTNAPFNTTLKSSKTQYLWTAAELLAAGVVAGNISSIKLNISNSGSDAQFLKIRMKHTTQSVLNASLPETTGFTDVYFLNTSFVNGMNQFNFYNNFPWNGTDNILVEFSFTNSNSGTDNVVTSDNTASIMGLTTAANDYHFEFSGNNHIDLGNANFGNFSNQITISFWSNGNPSALPANTSVLYATNAQNHRQANIHFPWSNSNIYWDCGSGGAYDRINQLATVPNFAGQWNHWAFTKNSTTGIMNIYLNGVLWLTGTGKTIPVQISTFMLGADPSLSNPYFGKMDEFCLFDTELSAATIQAWMYKTITPAHPNYTHLVAYYHFNEGTGTMCADATASPAVGNVVGSPVWHMFRGMDVFKNFEETNNRPMVTFVQGVYTQNITTTTLRDSTLNIAQTVYSFSTNGISISPVDTNTYYLAGYTYVYDGNTGVLIDSVLNTATGNINITTLNYYAKSPSMFQIMSFVTPYGINLDLKPTGKTWTFDVTDFGPILKGWKRMTMDAGGQWQEDMDIKFVFIVGTPPRNVRDINNLWKVESNGYGAILNDSKYEPRTVKMDASSNYYKIRTTISGHGQEGEFIPRNHHINVNGGAPEFSWLVAKGCAENPVYPQGGTWIYDRAGWCPGMATDMHESDITPYVTPGANAILDYSVDTASGDSRYWVSNQLVNYGEANFVLDAAITDIKNPSLKVEYARTNSICKNPVIEIQNTGSTTLTSATIEYWVNNNTQKETYNWTGNLGFLEKIDVTLPSTNDMWSSLNGPTNNTFRAEIKNPNGGTDAYSYNNKMNSPFNITNVVPADFVMWFKSNLFALETKYEIIDQNGTQVFLRNNMTNNTLYKDTFHLQNGCYSLIISDSDEDGINFWANNDGVGYARLRKLDNTNIITFQPDFGKSLIYNFTVDFPLSYDDVTNYNDINLYPNPATKQFFVTGKNIQTNMLKVMDNLGREIKIPAKKFEDKIEFDAATLATGMYYVVITNTNGKTQTKKVVIEK